MPAPPAVRATAPGWRDPRLWIGIAIVAVSVVAGARLLGAADDTVAVWAVAADIGRGRRCRPPTTWWRRRVRFADAGDLARYFTADDAAAGRPPADPWRRRRRAAAPRRRRRGGATATRSRSRSPSTPSRCRRRCGAGSVVDVYLVARRRAATGAAPAPSAGPALAAVTVVDAPALDGAFGDQRPAPARAGRAEDRRPPLLPAARLGWTARSSPSYGGADAMVVVLVVASGAAWESPALQLLGAPPRRRGAQALRRRRRPARRGHRRAGRRRRARARRPGPGRRRGRPPAPARRPPGGGRAARDAARRPAGCGPPGSASPALVAEDDLDALPDAVTAVEERRRLPPADGAGAPGGATAAAATGTAGRVIAVWGPAGAPGPHHAGRRPRRRAGPAPAPHRPRRRRPLRRRRRPAARHPRRGLRAARGRPARDRRPAGRAVRLRAARRRRPASRSSPGCRVPTAGSRSGPGRVEHLLEVAREHGHVVVDTGFSLEDDPASDFGVPPRPQPDDAGRPRGRRRGGRGRHRRPGRPVPAGARAGRAARPDRRRAGTGGGQPDAADPGLVREGRRRHGRGLRPAGRAALPARRPGRRPTAPWWPGRTLAEAGDSALGRAVAGLADALAPGTRRPGVTGGRAGRVRRRTAGTARRR